MTIKDYLPSGVKYDPSGGLLFARDEKGEYVPIADIRGWSYLVDIFDGDILKASNFQDKLGCFIVEAINYRLNKKEVPMT